MSSKAKLIITVGGNIEVIFTPPYYCVCEAKHSTKRNLQRHIQGCKDRHPCESIEGILKLKLQKTYSRHFKSIGCFLYFFCFLRLFCNPCFICFPCLFCNPYFICFLCLFCNPCFICFPCLFCNPYFICILCLFCNPCFIYTPQHHAGSISVHSISSGESTYAESDAVYFIYDESIGESIYAGSDPVSCVNDGSFGGYGYGVTC
ncbi:hypothetical protein KI688_006616 [Linnemannia hyalina]|uniref:Uncharacterized protein n=1 Tax=Linnemannia hyalina TaxID=64524 RepID=A0A9P7XKJ6_9FUNG|nr:hypothetical protein KI688_006616 [Linnemannia hyalina]